MHAILEQTVNFLRDFPTTCNRQAYQQEIFLFLNKGNMKCLHDLKQVQPLLLLLWYTVFLRQRLFPNAICKHH